MCGRRPCHRLPCRHRKPMNKTTETIINNSNEPVTVKINGRSIIVPAHTTSQPIPITVGQTFQVVDSTGTNTLTATQMGGMITIPPNATRAMSRSTLDLLVLYPLSQNRDVSDLKSTDIGGVKTPTSITFVNKTSNDVNVDWIDYDGKHQGDKTLKPDESYRTDTSVNNLWEVVVPERTLKYLPLSAAEYTVNIGAIDNPTLVPLQGSESENLKSGQPQGPATSINIHNGTTSDASVYVIDSGGNPQLKATIKPGDVEHEATFMNEPWKVVAGQNTTYYMPLESEADICIQ